MIPNVVNLVSLYSQSLMSHVLTRSRRHLSPHASSVYTDTPLFIFMFYFSILRSRAPSLGWIHSSPLLSPSAFQTTRGQHGSAVGGALSEEHQFIDQITCGSWRHRALEQARRAPNGARLAT